MSTNAPFDPLSDSKDRGPLHSLLLKIMGCVLIPLPFGLVAGGSRWLKHPDQPFPVIAAIVYGVVFLACLWLYFRPGSKAGGIIDPRTGRRFENE